MLTSLEHAICRVTADHVAATHGRGLDSLTGGFSPLFALVVQRGGRFFVWECLLPLHPVYCADPPPRNGRVCAEDWSGAERDQHATLAHLLDAATADLLAWSGHATLKDLDAALLTQGAQAFPVPA